MTAKEKNKLKSLGWFVDDIEGEDDHEIVKYHIAIRLRIKNKIEHKLDLWKRTEQVVDSLPENDVEVLLGDKQKLDDLAMEILLSQ